MLCCLAESSCDNNCQHSDGEESEHLIDEEELESDTTVDMNGLDVTKTDLHNEDLHVVTNGGGEAEGDGGDLGDHDKAEIQNRDRKYAGVTILVEERKVNMIPDSPLFGLGMGNQFPAGEIILQAEKLNEA